MPALPVLPEAPSPEAPLRPRRRGDCEAGPRPCPWAATCRHGLVGGVCTLDVVEGGEVGDDAIAALLGLPRTEVQLVARRAIRKLRLAAAAGALAAILDEDVLKER
jgi:hypothetical protein